MVVIQDATEPLSTVDGTINAGPVDRLLDQFIVEPLVIALQMVVLRVFLHGPRQIQIA